MGPNDDRELVLRCLARDAGACEELLDRYKDRVFSVVLRLAPTPQDAEDIVQESFLKAFRSLESYDPTRPLLTWLFKIAHNTALDHLRARRLEALSLDDEDDPLEVADSGPSLEASAEAASRAEGVERLLAALPPLYREVLVLRHQEELDYAQIAQVLGLPEGRR